MPGSVSSFSWDSVFQYVMTGVKLSIPEGRRKRIEGFLERFGKMVGPNSSSANS